MFLYHEAYWFTELFLFLDLKNALMQISVTVEPVTVAVYVLCSCDRQWMVE